MSHKEIGLTRINRKVNLNATIVPYNYYKLIIHNQNRT
jgi:hypothetical protein